MEGTNTTGLKQPFTFREEAFSAGKQFIRCVDEKHLEAAKTNLNNATDVKHVTGQQTHYFLLRFHNSSLHGKTAENQTLLTEICSNYVHVVGQLVCWS